MQSSHYIKYVLKICNTLNSHDVQKKTQPIDCGLNSVYSCLNATQTLCHSVCVKVLLNANNTDCFSEC